METMPGTNEILV